jgi:hypothetical protein
MWFYLAKFLSYRIAGVKRYPEYRMAPAAPPFFQRIRNLLSGGSTRPPLGRWAGGGGPPSAKSTVARHGLQVQVSCITPGLRIHISSAYFINWVYFGSPTTPVIGYTLPGRYIFSGDGAMLPKREIDDIVFNISPSFQPSLVRF